MAGEVSVHAIVVRRRDAGESDRRLTLFTEELGLIDVIAKGARKGGSRLSGSSDVLAVCVMQLAEGKKLRYLTQTQPITSFPGLRSDFDRLAAALALLELAGVVFPREQRIEDAFHALVASLRYIEVHEKPLVALVWAESRLMSEAGFRPELSRCVVSGRACKAMTCWISPHAGGLIENPGLVGWNDAFQVPLEVVIGAEKIADLDTPPRNLKFEGDVFRMLVRIWQARADDSLPAHQALISQLNSTL